MKILSLLLNKKKPLHDLGLKEEAEAYGETAEHLMVTRRLDAAIALCQRAIAIDKHCAKAYSELGIALLYKERFAGKILLILSDQGLGDIIQFVRYVPLVAARGAKIIFYCHKPVANLLQVSGVQEIITEFKTVTLDRYCYLMSLPYLLGTTLETIPADIPYLKADPKLAQTWQQILSHEKRLKVGLVWSGTTRVGAYARSFYVASRRNIHLSRLVPLGKIMNVCFYSLQKDEAAEQIKEVQGKIDLMDYTEKLIDFVDTAALIDNLDLVITVDTSVAHLAAAMGKPTWILSRFDGCWRWLEGRDDSPWYPTVRLFRQTKPGDWDEVIARVAVELEKGGLDLFGKLAQHLSYVFCSSMK